MSDVLEFPSRESRAYAFLEKELGDMLAAKGADAPLIAFATQTLREVYGDISEDSEIGFRVDLPAETTLEEAQRLQEQVGHGVDAMRRQHHDTLLKLAARLVLTEMKLFQERRGD